MFNASEPSWLTLARRFDGIAEIRGPQHHSAILDLLDAADGKQDGKPLQGIADDETPWCASFVSAVLELDGNVSARSAWARAYLSWGIELPVHALGAIAVLERGPKSGHVAFIAGRDSTNKIVLLGGNQSDMVRHSSFPTSRILSIRWPPGRPLPNPAGWQTLPLLDIAAPLSGSEA